MAEPARQPDYIWAAFPGSQTEFLRCPLFEVLYDGERGPGKSAALLMAFARWVNCGFGQAWRGIIFRRKYKELAKLIQESRSLFPRLFPGAKFRESPGGAEGYSWTFPGGEFLQFGQAYRRADIEDHLGMEWPFIGWDELCSQPNLDLYEAMKACCRSPMRGMPRMVRSTTNSWGPGHHAVRSYFKIDSTKPGEMIPTLHYTDPQTGERQTDYRCRITGYLHENVFLAENDPAYRAKLEAIADPNLRTAWIGGEDIWNISAGGIVGGVWSKGTHVIAPFQVPASWYVDRSYDYGSSKPFSFGWWAESDGTEYLHNGELRCSPPGSLYLLDEYYGWREDQPNVGLQLTTDALLETFAARENALHRKGGPLEHVRTVHDGPADHNIFAEPVNRKRGERTLAEEFAEECEVYWQKAHKGAGSRVNRARIIRDMLAEGVKDCPEDSCMYICDTPGTREGFQRTVPFLERSERNPDDADTDGEDHTWDQVGYRALASRAKIEGGKRSW